MNDIYIYICVCVCVCVCRHLCMYVCMYVCVYLCIYVSMYACMNVNIYLYVCVCVYTYVIYIVVTPLGAGTQAPSALMYELSLLDRSRGQYDHTLAVLALLSNLTQPTAQALSPDEALRLCISKVRTQYVSFAPIVGLF